MARRWPSNKGRTSAVAQKDGTSELSLQFLWKLLRSSSTNKIAGNASEFGEFNPNARMEILMGLLEQTVKTAKDVLLQETDKETKSLQNNLKDMKSLSAIEERFEEYLKKLNESFDKLKKMKMGLEGFDRVITQVVVGEKQNTDMGKDSEVMQVKSTDPTTKSFEAQQTEKSAMYSLKSADLPFNIEKEESVRDLALEQTSEIAGTDATVEKTTSKKDILKKSNSSEVLSQGNVMIPQSLPANWPTKSIEKKVSEEDFSGEQATEIGSPEATLREITFKEATKTATIGPQGGKMDLHKCRVIFTKNAVKKNTEFKLSINNKRKNFPKKGMPITPILDLQPSMEFDEPVLVKMRTWFCAAKGKKLSAQVYFKKDGGDWELDQDNKSIPLTDKNELSFYVRHFSGRVTAVSDSDRNKGLFCFLNDVYIQRGTAMLASVFCQDHKALSDCEAKLNKEEYVKVQPLHEEIKGKLKSWFIVEVACIEPSEANYLRSPSSRQLKEMSQSKPHECLYFPPKDFPRGYSGPFMADYAVKFQDTTNEDVDHVGIGTVLSRQFPIAIVPATTRDGINISVENKQDNPTTNQAMKMAGSMNITENSTTNTFANKQ